MNDDRELLEAAAKAAGINLRFLNTGRGPVPFSDGPGRVGEWNPLTDDGDALRLAVRKCFHICVFAASYIDGIQSPGFVEIWQDGDSDPLVVEHVRDGDYEAATRRAIVRAAAAIGETM